MQHGWVEERTGRNSEKIIANKAIYQQINFVIQHIYEEFVSTVIIQDYLLIKFKRPIKLNTAT